MVTLEFPHLLRLIERRQYDTIYHEHFSYLSLLTSSRALETAGLRVVDVDELGTHGGSLRVYARPDESGRRAERAGQGGAGRRGGRRPHSVAGHEGFARRGAEDQERPAWLPARGGARRPFRGRLRRPGKGNTLLNHCGIRSDLLEYTVDRSPFKHGQFLPGTHIPIYAPEQLAEIKPDYILVLPWNLREEISQQLAYVRAWGGAWSSRSPELEIV